MRTTLHYAPNGKHQPTWDQPWGTHISTFVSHFSLITNCWIFFSTRILYHCHFFSLLNQSQWEICQVLVTLIVLSRHWCLLIDTLLANDSSNAGDTTVYKVYADVFKVVATYVCSSRPQMLQYLILSFTKSIFLGGTMVGFLALATSFSGTDFHGLSGVTLRLGLACLTLSIIVSAQSMINTILFTMLDLKTWRDAIKENVHELLYNPNISLQLCALLVGASNLCGVVSILFFFIQFDHLMIFIYLGLLVFSSIGYGPLFAATFGTYYLYIKPLSGRGQSIHPRDD